MFFLFDKYEKQCSIKTNLLTIKYYFYGKKQKQETRQGLRYLQRNN